MKKYSCFLLLFLFSCFYIDFSVAVVEGESKVEKPAEEPVEYKDPKNYEQAKKEWDRSQEDLKEAQDKEDDVKKRLREMTKLQREGKVTLDDVRDFLDKEYGPTVKKRTAIEEAQKKLSENKLVAQYKKDLEAAYEPPVKEPIKEPSWWTRLTKRANAWFKERQADYYSWLGNKEKVVEIRTDLAEVYGDLGTNGLLDKARNKKQLSQEVEVLENKISHGLDAFEEYKLALDEGGITEKQKNEIKDEIRELSVDLLKLRGELGTEGIDRLKREIIDKKIDDVLEKFGIGKEERVALEKQAGIEPEKPEVPKTTAAIQKVQAEIRQQMPDVEKMTIVQRDVYVKKALTLAEANLAELPPEEKAIVHVTTRDALSEATDAALGEVLDPNKSVEDRANAVEQTLDYVPELGKTENQVHASFKDVVQKEGQEPEKKLDVLTEAQVEQMKNQLNQALEEMLKKIDAPEQAYKILKERIDAMEKIIDVKDVSINKLEAQVNMMNAKLEVLKKFQPKKAAKEIVDSLFRTIETTQKMEVNRSAMIKPDKQGNPVVVKEVPAAPPLPAKEFIVQKQKESVEYQQKLKKEGKPPVSRDALLESIRAGATLRKVTISEEPKARDVQFNVFSKAFDAMLKKGVIEGPPPG